MNTKEAKQWLEQQEFVRCKECASELLFDATLYGEDVVMVRQSSPEPTKVYFISMDLFAEKFEEVCIPPD